MSELLAPAGNIEALEAAIGEGADAVYLGLKSFNARVRSSNFAWNQFEATVQSLHRQNKKIYVTVNTVSEERDLERLYRFLGYLNRIGPDGLIVQDFGVVRMCQEFFPDLELHGSTQMNVESAAGVNLLSKAGLKRVVVARELGLESFLVLDDDYYYFGHRGESGAKKTMRLDEVFGYFIGFLKSTPTKCIAFSQGGDHIGGWDGSVLAKRKMMNSFFCLTSRPFKFYGMMNDDVNAYLRNGSVGDLYFTYMNFQLDQTDTQKNSGGLTESYKLSGTYVKSFYSIMIAPSVTRIRLMGESGKRMHHSIAWENACPCIISENFKK